MLQLCKFGFHRIESVFDLKVMFSELDIYYQALPDILTDDQWRQWVIDG